MKYFKNIRHHILVCLDDKGNRTIYNNGIRFYAPNWYQPAYEHIEEIDESEYRYIVASGDWDSPTPSNDAALYEDWD